MAGTESVEIEAEDNIIPLPETEVRNGRLHRGARSSISPTIEGISGSGSISPLEGS